MECRALDAVARTAIAERGYGEFFGHSLGHGLGLAVHEGPRVAKSSAQRLAVGNVITVEPGVYVPGVGGVRIEDDVVVGETTGRVLTHAPKDLTVIA